MENADRDGAAPAAEPTGPVRRAALVTWLALLTIATVLLARSHLQRPGLSVGTALPAIVVPLAPLFFAVRAVPKHARGAARPHRKANSPVVAALLVVAMVPVIAVPVVFPLVAGIASSAVYREVRTEDQPATVTDVVREIRHHRRRGGTYTTFEITVRLPNEQRVDIEVPDRPSLGETITVSVDPSGFAAPDDPFPVGFRVAFVLLTLAGLVGVVWFTVGLWRLPKPA